MESTKLNNELPKADDFFMLGLDARDSEFIPTYKDVEIELDSKDIQINDLKDKLSRTYSEEEVDRILRNFRTDFLPFGQVNDLVFNKWFEKFRKK